jgi:molecular chaperone DnaK (HSP70)
VRNQLDNVIHNAQSTIDEHGAKVSQEVREELINALSVARSNLKNDSIETLNAELKKLNDVVYKFSAAVQSAGAAGQQQGQTNY